jgi:hypothetical protein
MWPLLVDYCKPGERAYYDKWNRAMTSICFDSLTASLAGNAARGSRRMAGQPD